MFLVILSSQVVVMYPIETKSTWKISAKNTPASGWIDYGFSDSAWRSQEGGKSITNSGTIYLRQKFTGVSGMAAYEFTFYQLYGLIIYMNGKEVYRDFMNEWEPN